MKTIFNIREQVASVIECKREHTFIRHRAFSCVSLTTRGIKHRAIKEINDPIRPVREIIHGYDLLRNSGNKTRELCRIINKDEMNTKFCHVDWCFLVFIVVCKRILRVAVTIGAQ